jgi:hypothetical protein
MIFESLKNDKNFRIGETHNMVFQGKDLDDFQMLDIFEEICEPGVKGNKEAMRNWT